MAVARGPQRAQFLLVQGLGKLADGREAVVIGDHRARGDGQEGTDLTMALALAAAGIGHRGQGVEQAFGLAQTQARVARDGVFEGLEFGRQFGGREQLARLGMEFANKDRFGVLVQLVKVQAGAPPAFGRADLGPVGRPVTGALELLGIDKGFHQENGMAVAILPVLAEALQIAA